MDDGQEASWISPVAWCHGICTRSSSKEDLTVTQTHRPVESGAPGGNRTHVSQIALGVLSRLNYGTSHKAGHVVRYFVGAVLRRTRHMCRLGKFGWASGVIERRHSMPGIEPGPPRLSPRTVRPPYGWITDQLRPIRNEMVRAAGFAPAQSASQAEMLTVTSRP
jgi:hypothetical protein